MRKKIVNRCESIGFFFLQGFYPLVIRITKDRKFTYVYTGHYIEEKYWDESNRKIKKSHPNSVRLNNILTKKLAEASDTILDLQSNDNEVSSKQIKKQLVTPYGEESFNSLSKRYAFLTDEALNKIAETTIYNLDCWDKNKETENELKGLTNLLFLKDKNISDFQQINSLKLSKKLKLNKMKHL